MKTIFCAIALTFFTISGMSVQAQSNQQRGTIWGGLTGAAAGAIIGDHNDEAGAGAAIGGVVGAIAGSVLGNANDRDTRSYRASTSYGQGYRYQQPAYTPTSHLRGAVSPSDVIALTQSRVSDTVILNAIQNNGLQRRVEIADIVQMSQNGVSDTVIRAMQSGGSASAQVAARPVYVPQIQIASPRVYRAYSPHHPHHCHGGLYY